LRKGYHQVPVRPEDVEKTAVIMPFGLFEYLRIPFGLRNAAQTFQRLMDEVLTGLPFVFCYLDDIIVASVGHPQHAEHLREVLRRLQQHGLVLNEEKCVLGQESVVYLGHQVSSSGVQPLKKRVQAIEEFPQPKTVRQLMQFLGMINFYRRFIRGAAALLKPLSDALRGGQRANLVWTADMAAAFAESKKRLARVAELAHPRAGGELVLSVDASEAHVGAALQQKDARGALQPLGFFSKKLDKAQMKYSAFDRELLACYLGVRHFRWMLEGSKFYILSDHKPLTFALHRLSDAWSARQQRQLSYLAEYTSDIRHVAGVENVVADTLSRPAAAVRPVSGGVMDSEQLARAQEDCEQTQNLVGRPNVQVVEVSGQRLICENSQGVLKPIVPVDCRRRIFENVHGLAHAGVRATRRMVTSRYAWPGCSRDVESWCRDCVQCARGKPGLREKPATEAIEVPLRAFSHVHVDIVGPLPASSQGHSYLLTMLDRTTRWPEVIPLKTISAQVIADTFVLEWVARFGVPATVTTDRGTQFSGSVWKCMCKQLGTRHVSTTAYHPQANGLVERFHRALKEAIKARSAGAAWLENLPWILLGLRAAPKEEANVSAAEAALGAPLQLPGQLCPGGGVVSERPLIRSTVRTFAQVAQGPQQAGEGEMVYVRKGAQLGPLEPPYVGPYEVLQRRGKIVQLRIGARVDWVAADRIKRHVGAAEVEPAIPPPRGRPRTAAVDSGSVQ